MIEHHNYNPHYIHHRKTIESSLLRELIFGMEDGMVSTLGAITGIAIGTNDPFIIILAGFVVVSVESVSMAIGSYLSNKSMIAVEQRKLAEEKEEINNFPKEEKEELVEMYIQDGWTRQTSEQMAEEASKSPELMLKEMAYRELNVSPEAPQNPLLNALYMGSAYVIGGAIPVSSYLFLDIKSSLIISIVVTLIALFILGAYTTKFTKQNWLKSGSEMLILASVAALIGFGVAKLANMFA